MWRLLQAPLPPEPHSDRCAVPARSAVSLARDIEDRLSHVQEEARNVLGARLALSPTQSSGAIPWFPMYLRSKQTPRGRRRDLMQHTDGQPPKSVILGRLG